MKNIRIQIWVLPIVALAMLAGACTPFEELNSNPNTTNKGDVGMLSTTVVMNLVNRDAWNGSWSSGPFIGKYFFWGEQMSNYQYNQITNGSFNRIRRITDAQKMVECASDVVKPTYEGLYYLMKAMAFYETTMLMGDIPYTEAIDIESFRYPKYDDQKTVFSGILNDLAKADECFSRAKSPIAGDPYSFGGDVAKWRKATNTLRLRVLMSLSKRAQDTPDLAIKETFSSIASSCPVLDDGEDLLIEYSSKGGQICPLKQEIWKSVNVVAVSSVLIDPLKELGDYRLFYYLAPMAAATTPDNSFDSYEGIDPSIVFSSGTELINAGRYCRFNSFMRSTNTGIPFLFVGGAETWFLMAEAAERGWISGSAKTYYDKGVTAAMNYVKKYYYDFDNDAPVNKGMEIDDDYIKAYLNGPAAYKGGEEGIKQIITQKYLAGFLNGNFESWYEYRRTGYPEFPINPDTNLNEERMKMPVRFLYPQAETSYNKEQLELALQRQWGGVESVNKVMWVLK